MPPDVTLTAHVPDSRAHQGVLVTLLTITSFLAGAFAPTGTSGALEPKVFVAYAGVSVLVLAAFVLLAPAPPAPQVIGVMLFGAGLLLGTAVSPFAGQYSPGLVPSFVGVALVILSGPLKLSESGQAALHRVIRWTGVVYGAWILGILLGVPLVQRLTIAYFPAYYQELVEAMVLRVRHPVTAWGTHSVAALFYFFFVLYFRHDFTTTGRKSSALLALFYVGAVFSLRSFSGLFLGVWALAVVAVPPLTQVHSVTSKALGRRLAVMMWLLVGVVGVLLWKPLLDVLQGVLAIDVSGFSGRYSSGTGRIYQTVVWLRDHPLSPIGFTETDDLVYGDSAYIDYYLRGGVLAVLGVYLALGATVYRFLGTSRPGVHLYLAILAFDLGFSALPLFRIQLVLVPLLLALASRTRAVCPATHPWPDVRAGKAALQ